MHTPTKSSFKSFLVDIDHDKSILILLVNNSLNCRHACFGVYASSVQLCNTSRCVTRWYLSTYECSHQTHVGQPATSTHPDMRRVSWSQSAQTTTREVSFCNIASGHLINSAQRVLNNTEVKERNTICRHACFGVYASSVQLCNTSRCVTRWYLSTYECSHQTHVGQPATSTHPDMRRVSWSQSAQTTTREVSFCNIASGHPINSAQRVLNNTEVKERNTICRHACFGVYASSVQLCNTSRCDALVFIHIYPIH